MDDDAGLPYFLQGWDNLLQHFEEHFPDDSNARGDTFLTLAQRIIPVTEQGRNFPPPVVSEKKSYDGGVDIFTAENEQNQKLYVQSRFKIRSKDDFDNIISKFESYETTLRQARPSTGNIFEQGEEEKFIPPLFMMITASKIDGIRKNYLDSNVSSKPYYQTLAAEGRIVEIDGPRMSRPHSCPSLDV